MTSSRLMHWILCCLVVAVGVAGCSTDTTSGETSGSLSLNLEVGSVDIDEVDFLITGDGMDPLGGTIDTSAPGATASVEVFGLLPGDYTVTLSATATDGETMCEGSEHFSVEADELTEVMVYLRCKLPETLGGVRVNGEFNVCAVVNESVVKPLQTSVGNDIDLSAMGEDAEGDDITYLWTGTGGDIDDPNAMDTTYTCEEVGKHSVTITVSDDGFEYCMDSWTTVVTCVAGEAECTVDAQCADENDCTQNVCAEGRCLNPDEDAGASCDQDGGSVCDGEGTCVECNNNLDCDDGFVCNDNNECVPDVECTENAQCGDDNDCTQNLCAEGSCSNPNEDEGTSCSQDGGAVCDGAGDCVECNTSADCDDGFVCDESNACVPDVDCTENAQCADDNDCTQDLCTEGSCSNPNEDGGTSCSQDGGVVCDGDGNCVECNIDGDCETGQVCLDNNSCVGDPDIICNEGLCVDDSLKKAECREAFLLCIAENPNEEECAVAALLFCRGCTTDGDCNDQNQCTINTCEAGTCVSVDSDANETCDQSGGLVCDGNGACVGCNLNTQCPDDENECTAAICSGNACGQENEPANTACTTGGSVCDDDGNCVECTMNGQCGTGEACVDNVCEVTGPPTYTYDLSGSEFRAYSSLLDADEANCGTPDLNTVLYSTIQATTNTCVVSLPPEINGSFTVVDNEDGSFGVDGTQNLVFEINTVLLGNEVRIVTATTTTYEGTATGTVTDGTNPGQLTMDTIPDPTGGTNVFNLQAGTPCSCTPGTACGPAEGGECAEDGQLCITNSAVSTGGACDTGDLLCEAFDGSGNDVSAILCGAANLPPGLSDLPNIGDPLTRFINPIATVPGGLPGCPVPATSSCFALGLGPAAATGWFVLNPPPVSGSGSQFAALAGVQQ